MTLRHLLSTALLAVVSVAFAVVDFDTHEFAYADFRDADSVAEACGTPAAGFWCEVQDETLTRIPTKGVDLFFSPAGEIVAAYAKQQKGQNLQNYSLDNRQNVIPDDAAFPGGTLLLDGEPLERSDAEASWERISETVLEGTFRFAAGPFDVIKTVRVANTSHTVEIRLDATRREAAEGDDATPALQLAFPGISGVDAPVIKVGQGLGEAGSHATNPLSQAIPDPSYTSLQNNDRNTGFAIVMRPIEGSADVQAFPLPSLRATSLQSEAPREIGASSDLDATVYLGPNELVRYQQEGYVELPGLFRPNLLGRLSLGILWVLRTIHDYVGNWGLSIIVLTLLFRALVWPLIQTQTKSMFGMQELQPKIQALQKKYKDDRETLTQETMKLYKEAGVNPAGGCLPILLQMPLFIILWRVFVNFEFGEGFLWVPDLGQSDPFFILPILYIMVMFGMSWFSSRGNPQSLRQQILINVVFAFILFGFPAGVLLYFVVSMGIQVLQYWLINRGKNKPRPAVAKG